MKDIEKRIMAGDSWALIALMHERFIEEVALSISLIEKGASNNQLTPIYDYLREIIAELTLTFDKEHPIAKDLNKIYIDALRLLAEGFGQLKVSPLNDAIIIMRPLYQAFVEKSRNFPDKEIPTPTYGREMDLKS